MTAAALAVGVISSQAQGTVYSQNVVGYVNLTIPANGQFDLIANQLDLGAGSNSVNNVLSGSGLISASAGASQTLLLEWTGSSFEPYGYFNTADASPSAPGWYDLNTGNYATNTLNPSQAAFLQNPSGSAITVTLTGQVDQGTNTWTPVTTGLSFYSEPVPLAGTPLDSTNVNFPALSSVDYYQAYSPATGYGDAIQYYNAADASPSPAGWYDLNTGNYEDTNSAAWPAVGQGFLIYHGGSTATWKSVFNVQ